MPKTNSRTPEDIIENQFAEKRLPHTINYYISVASGYVEIVMGWIIMAVIIVLTIYLIIKFPKNIFDFQSDGFTEFLSKMLTLVVGLEFVKMLCMHTPETVIEVLMFATARQMIVEHLNAIDTLIGVITIGILFAIRKFLLLKPKPPASAKKASEKDDSIPSE